MHKLNNENKACATRKLSSAGDCGWSPAPPEPEASPWGEVIYRPGAPSHPNTMFLRPKRFDAQTEDGRAAAKEFLAENGFAVLKNALTAEEINHAKGLAWDFLEGLDTGIKRDQPNSWQCSNWPPRHKSGVVFERGAGSSTLNWYLRSNPTIKKIYETIWGTDNLITSMDGFNVFRPWFDHPERRTNPAWLHADQNPQLGNHTCVQGFANLLPTGVETGGFYCVPKTDRLDWKTLEMKSSKWDPYRVLEKDDEDRFNVLKKKKHGKLWDAVMQMPKVCVLPDPGDFVLWDSRTIHANHPGIKASGLTQREDELLRLVVFICMTPPRKFGVEKFVKDRIQACKNRDTSTHEPFRLILASSGDIKNFKATVGWNELTPSQRELVTGKRS